MSAFPTTGVSICSDALAKLGESGITSFGDGEKGAICESSYETSVRELITSYPWRFTIKQRELNQLVETPDHSFSYFYQLPSDFIGLIRIRPDYEFEQYGDKLAMDFDGSVILDYQYLPDEGIFPEYFTVALIFLTASNLAMPITESTTKAKYLRDMYDKVFLPKAKNNASRQNQTRSLGKGTASKRRGFSLIDVRG